MSFNPFLAQADTTILGWFNIVQDAITTLARSSARHIQISRPP